MLANSKNQNLIKHSIAVANLALLLFKKLEFSDSSLIKKTFENIDALKNSIFMAGLLHDIGKIDPNFQNFILKEKVTDSMIDDGVHFLQSNKKEDEKFSFLNYPRHNELSWAISSKLLLRHFNDSLYAIYYHHAKIKRTKEWNSNQIIENSLKDNDFKEMVELVNYFFEECLKFKNYFSIYENIVIETQKNIKEIDIESGNNMPPGFIFCGVNKSSIKDRSINEIRNLLVRSLIVSADRIVSGLSTEELDDLIESEYYDCLVNTQCSNNSLSNSVQNMLDNFNVENQSNPINLDRDKKQKAISESLANKNDIAVLFGPAGCGKTKIFLEWYKNKVIKNPDDNNKKLYIIAPRKMICTSLFNELSGQYIINSKIELITGDNKLLWDGKKVINLEEENTNIQSEVVITTIDQLISIMLSHKKIDMLYEFLNSYVVFDEFHEFFNIPGVVLLFQLFIKLKSFKENNKTLLVSATPNYYLLENILELNSKHSVEYIDTFNKEKYNIKLSTYDLEPNKKDLSLSILYEEQKPGTIVIFNTAKLAQKTTIEVSNEDVLCFHSKFNLEDKLNIYKEIKKNWSKKDPATQKVLRSGPILQASLNISTMNLITQSCSAENWLQRMGRCNRFASNTSMANFITVLNNKTLEGIISNNPEMKELDYMSMANQTLAWLNYLNNKKFNVENKVVETTLSEIYKDYKEFHSLDDTKKAYDMDYEKIIEKSLKIFECNDFTPYEYFKPKKNKNKKLSSISIRGANVYALPTCYDIYQGLGNWLYVPSQNVDHNKLISISEIDLESDPKITRNQINLLESTRLKEFKNTTYATQKAYKNMNLNKIKIEAKNFTSPVLLSYPSGVNNYDILNQNVWFYISKGNIKIGLYKI